MAVQLLPEHGHVVIARVVQPEMGRAAPQLDLLHAQPLLAVQRLCRVAEPLGIQLAMESLRADESNLVNSLERAKRMYQEVGHLLSIQ